MNYTWRTIPQQFFITPTFQEIKDALPKNIGNLKVSFNLVQDVFNVLSFEYFDEDINSALVNLATVDYQSLFIGETPIRRVELIEKQKRMDYSIQTFLSEFNFFQISGNQPLEKAINTVLALSKLESKNTQIQNAQQIKDFVPVFFQYDGDELGYLLSDYLDNFKDLSDEVCKILDFNKNSTKSIIDASTEIKMIAEISRKLKKLHKFKTTAGMKFSQSASGHKTKRKNMTNLSQISNVNPKAYLGLNKEYLNYKLATKSISIQEKGELINNKQLLYLLIDKSASMTMTNRILTAKAILLNRLEAVVKGQAVLFVSFFDKSVSQEFKIESLEEAREMYNKIVKCEFDGGSTNIDFALRNAVERIKSINTNKNLVKPEIVIVTDGDDTVMTNKASLEDLTLHAFLVGGQNKELLELAEKSGGVFYSFIS